MIIEYKEGDLVSISGVKSDEYFLVIGINESLNCIIVLVGNEEHHVLIGMISCCHVDNSGDNNET